MSSLHYELTYSLALSLGGKIYVDISPPLREAEQNLSRPTSCAARTVLTRLPQVR